MNEIIDALMCTSLVASVNLFDLEISNLFGAYKTVGIKTSSSYLHYEPKS